MREPIVAGKFYTDNSSILRKELKSYIEVKPYSKNIPWGIVSPHAGYMYSGKTAGIAYNELFNNSEINRIVLLGPSHTGIGNHTEISDEKWKTPLGIIESDEEAIKFLKEKGLRTGSQSHLYEHSLEVQLPFLQYGLKPGFKIIPICLKDYSLKASANIANILFEMESSVKGNTVYIASSDFSHYLSPDIIRDIDNKALRMIEKGDPEGFFSLVVNNELSICGFLPITIMLYLNRLKKGQNIKVLNYSHSGEVLPSDEVVGYAAIAFYL